MVEVRASATLIAERYRVEASLGVGGMGAVYLVRDERSGRSVALKELHVTEGSVNALIASQFEREYHTLVQLSHPSIIEVYDYGVDQRGYPFYTMELLDGQDLRERPQPSWQEACALLRDVASSLAIMHSRRLLHRDISARNIRCTTNGRAKLIDFGAMAPMGVLKTIVGTPPFVPPEALQMQALDGRSDLYALGGVLYWIMTRRHAYPARNFNELPDLWRTPIASPRQYDADLPPALDQLIMQLLQLDRNARPASAAEVIERLSGIANLPLDERPAVSAAYLSTPMLVGRDAVLKQVRGQLLKARQGQGHTILVEGAPGLGRSRALDACVLDAKLLGAIVLRGGAGDAADGDYGVLRSLAEQLFAAVPRLARRSAALRKDVLAHVLPRLRDPETVVPSFAASLSPIPLASLPRFTVMPTVMPGGMESHPPGLSERAPPDANPVAKRPERRALQSALRDFIMSVARDKHLVLVVDDVESIDEPSAAVLVQLANSAKRRKLTLLLAAPEAAVVKGSSASALGLLRQIGERITLEPLDAAESEALLRSVFGEVPNIAAVSERVHRIAGGNPRWTLELIQHLVNRGLARYEAGSWALPSTLAAGDVPASLSESFMAKLSEVSEDARGLAEVLALTDTAALPVSEYSKLTDHGDRARTYGALSDLVASGVLIGAGESYRFSYGEVAPLLSARLSPERARELHGRIARQMPLADNAGQLAEHQLLGGMEQEGVQLVLALCTDDAPPPPARMCGLIDRALRSAESIGLPARVCSVLRCRLLFLSALLGDYERFSSLLPVVREALLRDSGLSDYAELQAVADSDARAREAVLRARQRREALPEAKRAFIPEEAGAWLSFFCGACAYMAAIAQEIAFVDDLPLTAPMVPLSPLLLNMDRMMAGQRALQQGRDGVSRAHCEAILQAFDSPAYASMTPIERAIRRGPFLYMLGLFDAVLGKPAALDSMKQLDLPTQRVNAWRVRMVYELMHGRVEAAAACQRRAELLALQDSNSATLPGTTVRTELLAAIYADDVLAVKRCMERSEALAQRYPRWKPTLAIARAHYRRLQGDPEAALVFAQESLTLVQPGRHLNWGLAVTTQLALLNALGRAEEALVLSASYLDIAVAEALDSARIPLLRVTAESCVMTGRLEQARRMADEHLAHHVAAGTQGLQLGLAYETLARVAIAMHDEAGVQRYAELCAAEYKGSRNALLSRKYQQLMREADEAGVAVGTTQRHAADFTAMASGVSDPAQTLHSRLLSAGSGERSEQALQLLLETHGAVAGYLFGTQEGQLELLAASHDDEPSLELVRTFEGCLVTLSQVAQPASEVADEEATMMQPLGEAAGSDSTAFENLESDSSQSEFGAQLDVNVDGFEPLPLFAKSEGERVLVALAALRFESGSRRVVPSNVLAAFADALLKRESAEAPEEIA